MNDEQLMFKGPNPFVSIWFACRSDIHRQKLKYPRQLTRSFQISTSQRFAHIFQFLRVR